MSSSLPVTRVLDRIISVAILAVPIFLLHGRGIAEAAIDTTAICFLLRSAGTGEWSWLRAPWITVAALWWGWLVLCSIPVGPLGAGGVPALVQAVATLRFLVFVAALQTRLPQEPGVLRWVRRLVVLAALYIVAQLLLQDLTGHNLFGQPRFHDGTLTGPYDEPRAAAPLSRLLLPTLLAGCAVLLGSRLGRITRLAAVLLLTLLAIAVMVLSGQRMPLALFLFGLLVSGLLLPGLRLPLLAACIAAPVLIALSALVSPRSFFHLVVLFEQQMSHFGHSPYGLIWTRAAAMGLDNPLTGLGFDAFRHRCADPHYFRAWPVWQAVPGDGGGAAICVQHAHNHYLQALTDSGIAGLLLFALTVAFWLTALARGLLRREVPAGTFVHRAWRVGLFAAVFIHEWPISSTSAFTNLPLGGWFFLLLGLGLAEAAPYMQRTVMEERRDV